MMASIKDLEALNDKNRDAFTKVDKNINLLQTQLNVLNDRLDTLPTLEKVTAAITAAIANIPPAPPPQPQPKPAPQVQPAPALANPANPQPVAHPPKVPKPVIEPFNSTPSKYATRCFQIKQANLIY
eukprot:Phypoly_transcript_08593.p2 GENE.Phypoly_transcript_08593~~Phypoly_transcript_08593.p2  ORF type:complete len:127 (-),score=26.60 Phypoly_transcript_08593:382-762(-)